ncbi:MAG: ABC transporter substrate-binding protein [Nitrososphaerales archaeon]
MNRRNGTIIVVILVVLSISIVYFSIARSTDVSAFNTIRIGYFPNLNHAQAMVGIARGTFEQASGDNIKVEYKIFNAGPSVIEALFTDQIDIAYTGPSPAITGYMRSNQDLKIIAGSSSGGVAFIVRSDMNIESPSDFAGKRFASPQYGNTQDISLKWYLVNHGYSLAQYGGNVQVLSAKNSDIMTLFLKKELDGAWVPEPWAALLVKNANGQIFLDERDLWTDGEFATTLLVVNSKFLQNHPDLVKKVIMAHVETTLWIKEQPDQAEQIINEHLKKLFGKPLPSDVMHESFSRIKVTYNPMKPSVMKFADEASELGLYGDEKPDLSDIYYAELLNEVLREKELSLVE